MDDDLSNGRGCTLHLGEPGSNPTRPIVNTEVVKCLLYVGIYGLLCIDVHGHDRSSKTSFSPLFLRERFKSAKRQNFKSTKANYSFSQGCQMVNFQPKNPDLGNFWWVLQWKMLAYICPIGKF
jgi:hypothetical protein